MYRGMVVGSGLFIMVNLIIYYEIQSSGPMKEGKVPVPQTAPAFMG
jgi:hypothetical protein